MTTTNPSSPSQTSHNSHDGSPDRSIHFTKMHGLGNDFMVIDQISQPDLHLSATDIQFLSDRHRGIGFDQLLIIAPASHPDADFDYRIFNADGDEVEQCGNGARCFAKFIHDQGLSEKAVLTVNTTNGLIRPEKICSNIYRVEMNSPRFAPEALPFLPNHDTVAAKNPTESLATSNTFTFTTSQAIPATMPTMTFGIVSMGNPHAVMVVDSVDNCDVNTIGAYIESHPAFPNRVNVGFLEIIDSSRAKLRVYERGVGETQACGTGACAAAVYGQQLGKLNPKSTIELRGGALTIEWAQVEKKSVYMEGEATTVFSGIIQLP